MTDHQPSNTERTRRDESFERLRRQNELILNAAGEGIYGLDLQGNVTFVNPAAAQMIGWGVEELIDKTMHDILHHSKADGTPYPLEECPIYAAFRDGTIHHVTDEVFWRKDGTCFRVEYISTPIRDEHGELVGAVVTFRDITGRKQLEEAQLEVTMALANAMPGISRLDSDGRYVHVSEIYTQMLGYGPVELIGMSWETTVHPEDREKAFTAHKRMMTEGKAEFEARAVRKDGSIFHKHVLMVKSLRSDANFIGHHCFMRDITERKQAEQALRDSEERYRALYDDNPSMYFTVDQDGTVLSVNPFGAQQLGYTVHQLVGRSVLDVFHEEDREAVLQQLAACVRNPTQVARWEFRKVHKDGNMLWVREAARSVQGADGKPVVLIVCEDITERKRAEEALHESKRRLHQQNRVLVELTRTGTIGCGDLEAALKEVTEAAAKTLDVERVGVWLYNDERSMIRCIQQYELSARRHTKGAELAAAEYPSYFQALEENRAIDAHDAHTDPRTREFSQRYLTPYGITSMLDAPIRVGGEMVGVVCHEHVGAPRRWILEEQSFAGSVADIVGLVLETHERKRAEEALRRAHDMLELAVQERTAELSKTIGILEEQIAERHRVEEVLRSSQEQLRALSVRLLSVQEEERGRIAREIHDELGQALTALKIDLAWVAQRLPASQEPLQKKTERMTQLVDTTVQTVRRISTELRPRVLDHLGLIAALEWQVREFQDRTGIASVFTSNLEEISLDAMRATTLFRICQEALTNVTRHANATRVKLDLKKVGRDLFLEVRDNGRGIAKEAIADPKSLGLIGMRERVLPMGGDVDVKGFRGKGTVVSVRIPVG